MSNWLDASYSNRYRQMYIKGFLDISGGNLILRNNNLFVKQGDASLNGKLFVANDTSFNGRLYVGDNIYASKNLIVNGDISLNGNITMKFQDGSIPPNAIFGGIPASTGIFDTDVSINTRLSVNKDASLNANLHIRGKTVSVGDVSMNANLYVGKTIYENGASLQSVYATLASPTFTGTVNGITKSMVGLALVDNTADIDKPVSTATQTALNLKSNTDSPAFTGIPTVPTAASTTSTTQIASTAYVKGQLAGYVTLSSPSFLTQITTPKLIATSDVSFIGTKFFVNGDTSMNGNLRIGKSIYEGNVALTNKYAQLAAPTFVGTVTMQDDVSMNNRLFISSDVSLNGKLYVNKNTLLNNDVSMNNNLDLSGSMIARNNINVYGIINQYTTTLDQGYIVNYATNGVTTAGDISANGILLGKLANGSNTIVGINAGTAITTGTNNVCLGYNSGATLSTGSNNIVLGTNATSSSSTVSNEITLGNSSITTLRCQSQSITSLSDIRDKKDIRPIPVGLDFVGNLNPVSFMWNSRDGSKCEIEEFGFIAQELQTLQDESGIYVPHLVNNSNPEKLEASYGVLLPILVKAIQELKEITAKQQAEITDLKLKLNA